MLDETLVEVNEITVLVDDAREVVDEIREELLGQAAEYLPVMISLIHVP